MTPPAFAASATRTIDVPSNSKNLDALDQPPALAGPARISTRPFGNRQAGASLAVIIVPSVSRTSGPAVQAPVPVPPDGAV